MRCLCDHKTLPLVVKVLKLIFWAGSPITQCTGDRTIGDIWVGIRALAERGNKRKKDRTIGTVEGVNCSADELKLIDTSVTDSWTLCNELTWG